ncbi:MAG TPA: 8-oxo-dGTP diphosphatase MutT [Methylomirabilota bacterium]|nr:8-oxo-dGTP diphosphatase MutT [Methylomirabilota bacterium]
MAEVVEVVAAVIERDGRYLITRRLEDTHLAGLWEFPGGKVWPGEQPEVALKRELSEELGVTAEVGELLESVDWSYPEKTVHILFFRCAIPGEPQPLQGQEMLWIEAAELSSRRFPEADAHLISRLSRTR